jgi:uncharacterized protein YceH (UPF0502 family)
MNDELKKLIESTAAETHDLDRRVRTLEENVTDLQSRVERLESSTH